MNNGFSLFGIDIRYYSLFILIGVIVAYILIMKESKKQNINTIFMAFVLAIVHFIIDEAIVKPIIRSCDKK